MKKIIAIVCTLMLLVTTGAIAENDEPVVLKVYYSSPNPYPNWSWGEDPVSTWITIQTGIALDITFSSTDDNQQFYTMLASDEIAKYDLLMLSKYESQLVENGYVLALNKLADEYCPQWYDVVSELERDIHAIDGNIYYTTYGFSDPQRLSSLPAAHKAMSMWYNYIAMDKLGYDATRIETLEDVEVIAKRLRDEVGINYPIYLVSGFGATSVLDFAQVLSTSSFAAPGVVYPQSDGTVTYNVKSTEYKAALEWLNKMYKEGLVRADQFTYTTSINDENVKNIAQKADVGFVLGHFYVLNQHRPEGNGGGVHGNGEMGMLQFAGQTPLADGVSADDIVLSDFLQTNIGSPRYYVLDRTQHPAECIKFITFMFSDECQRTNMYGLEGQAYTMEYSSLFGIEIMTPTEEAAADKIMLSGEDYMMKYGALVPWQNEFRSAYGQNWASLPQIIVEEDGMKKQYGEMTMVVGNLYGTSFMTGLQTLNLTNTDDVVLRNNVEEAWENNLFQCVIADDFEAAYKTMIDEMEYVGLAKLEKILTERYWYYDEIFHEVRNEKWHKACGR